MFPEMSHVSWLWFVGVLTNTCGGGMTKFSEPIGQGGQMNFAEKDSY